MKMDVGEWIVFHPPFGDCNARDFLEIFEVLGRRVVTTFSDGLQVKFVVLYELMRKLVLIEVVFFVGVADKFFGQPQAGFVTLDGCCGDVDAR